MVESVNGNNPIQQTQQSQETVVNSQSQETENSVFSYREVRNETNLRRKDIKLFDLDKNGKIDEKEFNEIKKFVDKYDIFRPAGMIEGDEEWAEPKPVLKAMRKAAKLQARADKAKARADKSQDPNDRARADKLQAKADEAKTNAQTMDNEATARVDKTCKILKEQRNSGVVWPCAPSSDGEYSYGDIKGVTHLRRKDIKLFDSDKNGKIDEKEFNEIKKFVNKYEIYHNCRIDGVEEWNEVRPVLKAMRKAEKLQTKADKAKTKADKSQDPNDKARADKLQAKADEAKTNAQTIADEAKVRVDEQYKILMDKIASGEIQVVTYTGNHTYSGDRAGAYSITFFH